MNQLDKTRIPVPVSTRKRIPTRIRIAMLTSILKGSRNIVLPAALVLTGLFSFAQNTKVVNDKNAEKRDVKDFHAISIGGGIDLYLDQGSQEAVAISATDPAVQRRIKTAVENGVLKIWLEQEGGRWGGGNSKMKAYVTCKELTELRASGGSDVYAEDGIRSDKLAIRLSGGSDIKTKTEISGDLSIEATGGSDVYISGKASKLTVEATGGSDVHGYDLVSDFCNVSASGGSDIKIGVNKELNVTASGGSDVYYKGTAVVHQVSSSGGSDVIKKG